MALHELKITVVQGGTGKTIDNGGSGNNGAKLSKDKNSKTWKLTHPKEVIEDKLKQKFQLSPKMAYVGGVATSLAKQVVGSAFGSMFECVIFNIK